MTPNRPMLSIAKAREASKRLGLRSMIVLQEWPDGTWGYTSYGDTRKNCDRAKFLADECMREVPVFGWEWDDMQERKRIK